MDARGWFVSLVGLGMACGSSGVPPTAPPSPRQARQDDLADASVRAIPADAAPAAITLGVDDCRLLHGAPALAIATVTKHTPDCSGVGHSRIVLEVNRLVRGANITTLVTSRPLYGKRELGVGEILVVAIDPQVRRAETVYCVPLPAHEGTVRHAIEVSSLAEADRIAGELEAGRLCPPAQSQPSRNRMGGLLGG